MSKDKNDTLRKLILDCNGIRNISPLTNSLKKNSGLTELSLIGIFNYICFFFLLKKTKGNFLQDKAFFDFSELLLENSCLCNVDLTSVSNISRESLHKVISSLNFNDNLVFLSLRHSYSERILYDSIKIKLKKNQEKKSIKILFLLMRKEKTCMVSKLPRRLLIHVFKFY